MLFPPSLLPARLLARADGRPAPPAVSPSGAARPSHLLSSVRSRVKAPMDLDLIKLRLTKGYYKAADELAQDVARVWRNACEFNPAGSIVHRFALECSSFWEEHLGQTLTAHAAGLLAGGGQPARKRKPQPTQKREASAGADADGGEGAPAGSARARPPKVAKRERAQAGAPAGDEEGGGGQPGTHAPGAEPRGGAGTGGARVLAKGWALEVIPENGAQPHADAQRAPAPGQGRVRKAKVRWEPEEIASAAAAERKAAAGAHGGGAAAGGNGAAAPNGGVVRDAGGAVLPQPPGVRKQRRSSGGTRCGLQESAREHSAAQWGACDSELAGSAGSEERPGAFTTPGSFGGLHARSGAIAASAPTTLYDVAAALPEIDVGDDLEGVAGDLDDLLDFLPLGVPAQPSPLGLAARGAEGAALGGCAGGEAAQRQAAGEEGGAEQRAARQGPACEGGDGLGPMEPGDDSQEAMPLECFLAIDV